AVPRCLRLSPETVRHLTPGGFASPTRLSTAGARRGHRSDLAILLSPSARERFPLSLTNKARDHGHDACLEYLGRIGPCIHHGGEIGVGPTGVGGPTVGKSLCEMA